MSDYYYGYIYGWPDEPAQPKPQIQKPKNVPVQQLLQKPEETIDQWRKRLRNWNYSEMAIAEIINGTYPPLHGKPDA